MKKKSASGEVAEPAYYHLPITAWPPEERPREKLTHRGAGALSDAELLAILIRTGIKGATALDLARKLLADGTSLKDISAMSVEEIQMRGIGSARAVALVAAFELAKRLPEVRSKDRLIVESPEDLVNRFGAKLRDLRQEEFWVFPLNAANRLLEPKQVSRGILNASLAHPRECFREAITQSAASVIFVHNHPSGNPEPSQEDLAITRQLVEAGRILGIAVLDHLILTPDRFTSFAERKLIS